MSMLTFYINRAGRQLTRAQRARLQAAKGELRALFKKTPRKRECRDSASSVSRSRSTAQARVTRPGGPAEAPAVAGQRISIRGARALTTRTPVVDRPPGLASFERRGVQPG